MKAIRCALVPVSLFALACSDSTGPDARPALKIWAEVIPSTASISDTAASLKIRVHAYNPNFVTIKLKGGPPYVFAGDPANSSGLEEAFSIGRDTQPLNAGPSFQYWGQPEYVFLPFHHEYTEEIVTLKQWRTGGWPLLPGQYRVRAYYNSREGTSATLTLIP